MDGKVMQEVCRLFGIEKLRTSAYKLSTTVVESFHRTINPVLAKIVSGQQKDWDCRQPFAMAGYCASTGYSLNFLTFGRYVYGAVDVLYRSLDETYARTIDYDDFVIQARAERHKCKVRPERFAVGLLL